MFLKRKILSIIFIATFVFAGTLGIVNFVYAFGGELEVWGIKNSVKKWTGVAISSDGKYLTAVNVGYISISSDYGATWYNKGGSATGYTSIAMSNSGQYQTVVELEGLLYNSSNYGNSWIPNRNIGAYWRDVAVSGSGQYQTAVKSLVGKIYISSDFGATWITRDSFRQWRGVSVSNTGQYQTAVVHNGGIYISSDYGNNWTAKSVSAQWSDVAISSTGQYQTATMTNGNVYASSDYGNNWIIVPNTIGTNVSISDNGQYQTVVAGGNYVYVSSDYGKTWLALKRLGTMDWRGVAISGDGKRQIIAAYNDKLYVTGGWLKNEEIKTSYESIFSSDTRCTTCRPNDVYVTESIAQYIADLNKNIYHPGETMNLTVSWKRISTDTVSLMTVRSLWAVINGNTKDVSGGYSVNFVAPQSLGEHNLTIQSTSYIQDMGFFTEKKIPFTVVERSERFESLDCSGPDGVAIPNGSSRTYYTSMSLTCGQTCTSVAETRTCKNGILSGSAINRNCSVDVCASCTAPDNSLVSHGNNITTYTSPSVACGQLCSSVAQTRTCNNGVLSGTATNMSCSSNTCASCVGPDGAVILNGESKTYYTRSAVACGLSCSSGGGANGSTQIRLCTNGVLSGTALYPSCSVQCLTNGVCGTANNVGTTVKPTTNLCSAGTASAVSGTGPWTWNCNGTNGGTRASCSAPYSTVNRAPNPPIISGPTSVNPGTPTLFYFVSTDPDNDRIRYGIDWSSPSDGIADVWVPSGTSYVNSGALQSYSYFFLVFGQSSFKVLAQDIFGLNSAWSTHNFVVGFSCTGPDGSIIQSGNSKTYYNKSCGVVSCSGANQQTRICNSGVLSGSYTKASCSTVPCVTPIDGAVGTANGVSVTSAPTSGLCSSGTASAVSGTGPWTWTCTGLNGGATVSGLAPVACLGPDGTTIANGSGKTYYNKSCGVVSCSGVNQQTRICNNGVLSGSYTNTSCLSGVNSCADFNLVKSRNITLNTSPLGALSTRTVITISPISSFSGDVYFSASSPNLPLGTVYIFTPNMASSLEYSSGVGLRVFVPAVVPVGIYTVTVTGVSGGITKTVDVLMNAGVVDPMVEEF